MGMLAVVAHSFDQWCVRVIGVALGTSNVLLVATLASASITQACPPAAHTAAHLRVYCKACSELLIGAATFAVRQLSLGGSPEP